MYFVTLLAVYINFDCIDHDYVIYASLRQEAPNNGIVSLKILYWFTEGIAWMKQQIMLKNTHF